MEDYHSQPDEYPQSRDTQLRDIQHIHEDAPHLPLELAQEAVDASGECDRFDNDAPLNRAFLNEAFVEVPAKARKGRPAAETKHLLNPQITKPSAQWLYVSPDQLRARPGQPRQLFEPKTLTELARSVQSYGVLQPIIVRPLPTDPDALPTYEIVAGERRCRASQEAGLAQVPVLVQSINDELAAEIGLVENLQRQDLTPLETASALAQMNKQGYSIRKLATKLGKNKGWVEQYLALACLPGDLRELVSGRPDTLTHVRELEKVADPALRSELIARVVDKKNPLTLTELRCRIRQSEAKEATSAEADAVPTADDLEITGSLGLVADDLGLVAANEVGDENEPECHGYNDCSLEISSVGDVAEAGLGDIPLGDQAESQQGEDSLTNDCDAEAPDDLNFVENDEHPEPVDPVEAARCQEALKASLRALTRELDEFERPSDPAVLEEMTHLIQRLQLALGITLHHWSLDEETKSSLS